MIAAELSALFEVYQCLARDQEGGGWWHCRHLRSEMVGICRDSFFTFGLVKQKHRCDDISVACMMLMDRCWMLEWPITRPISRCLPHRYTTSFLPIKNRSQMKPMYCILGALKHAPPHGAASKISLRRVASRRRLWRP